MSAAGAEERLTLVDGRSVVVRPCREADAEGIAALVRGLSVESRAMRFGAARAGLSPEEARAMSAAPGPGGVGLVAVAGAEAERIVALARYHREPGASEAELAVAVADAWHGLGLGTGLIERLRERAAAEGLDALWAYLRPDNWKMRGVFRALGGDVHTMNAPDECLVRIALHADDALEEASAARFITAAAASLQPLFRPRSIAVVGASRNPRSPGGAVFATLVGSGFPGPLYAINRAAGEVAGRPAHPSLVAVPEPVDLVVVAVPAADVPAVARQAAGCGARALVVLSSGFSEAGADGAALEAELVHIVRTSGLRMVGPNCLGVAVPAGPAPFDATFAPLSPAPGRIAFASQSGGLGIATLSYCAARGLGLSAFVSLGNKADVSSNDLLAWWERDEGTRVVLLYLEDFGNPRRFARVARRVARSTPVVALKAGRGAAGRRAAGSHTAALAAGEAPTDALFDLAGVIRAQTLEELLETGELLAGQPLPAGDRVGIVSNAGGPGILAADACEAMGLSVPVLGADLQAELARAVPGVAATSNPVDLGAGSGGERFAAAGRALIDSGEIDALMVLSTPVRGTDPDAVARAVEGLADGRLPVLGCLLGARAPDDGAGAAWPVPWLAMPEGTSRALANAWRAEQARRRPPDPAARPSQIDPGAARGVLAAAEPDAWLPPEDLRRLLDAYGIASVRQVAVDGPEAAAAAQSQIGAPVAVKLVSRTVTHKADVGGVVLDCRSPEAAAAAVRRIAAALARVGRAGEMEGALVQEMAPDGPDLIVGGVQDPVFGPVVLAGIGGGEAELWGDRKVALAPVGHVTARELWSGLHGAALLDGWRGAPATPREPLAELTERVAWLLADQPLLAELDLNPVRAGRDGRPLVLDARGRRTAGLPGD
jgi:acyl-CoA synthetase (NDP forming)/GNAT superfamily N-acetyltransferase